MPPPPTPTTLEDAIKIATARNIQAAEDLAAAKIFFSAAKVVAATTLAVGYTTPTARTAAFMANCKSIRRFFSKDSNFESTELVCTPADELYQILLALHTTQLRKQALPNSSPLSPSTLRRRSQATQPLSPSHVLRMPPLSQPLSPPEWSLIRRSIFRDVSRKSILVASNLDHCCVGYSSNLAAFGQATTPAQTQAIADQAEDFLRRAQAAVDNPATGAAILAAATPPPPPPPPSPPPSTASVVSLRPVESIPLVVAISPPVISSQTGSEPSPASPATEPAAVPIGDPAPVIQPVSRFVRVPFPFPLIILLTGISRTAHHRHPSSHQRPSRLLSRSLQSRAFRRSKRSRSSLQFRLPSFQVILDPSHRLLLLRLSPLLYRSAILHRLFSLFRGSFESHFRFR